MSTAQRLIKYAALALAVLIIASIASAIVGIITSVFGFLDYDEPSDGPLTVDSFERNEVTRLEIELSAASLTLNVGEELSVSKDSDKISARVSGSTLKITDSGSLRGHECHVTLSVPADMTFDYAELDMGAGVLTVSTMRTERLDLDLGAGEANISELYVLGACEIDSGAGELNIVSAEMERLSLNHGVGEVNIKALLSGNSEFDCGVGELNLTLVGAREAFKLDVDKGLGTVSVGGEALSSGIHGNGDIRIDIDSGIGAVNISFE